SPNLSPWALGKSPREAITMDVATIRAKLAGFGTPIGEYSQGVGVSLGKLKSYVHGGMCQGACLDWIRRMLLGGKLRPFPADGTARERQYLKAALLQLMLEDSKKPFLEAGRARLQQQANREFEAAKAERFDQTKKAYDSAFNQMLQSKAK